MGYFLQALIGKQNILKVHAPKYKNATVIELRENIGLIPITDELYEEIEGEQSDEFYRLSESVESWARLISADGLVAYIEAEYFGGDGGQSVVAWTGGNKCLELSFCKNAFNQVLKLLDVKPAKDSDEFDAVGLGMHRNTKDWVGNS